MEHHHTTPSSSSTHGQHGTRSPQFTPSSVPRSSQPNTPASKTPNKRKSRIAEYVEHQQWHDANWFSELLEVLFRINERKTSVNLEVYAGVIQFISCTVLIGVL